MSRLPVRVKAPRKKVCHVGAPAIFKLEQCCAVLNKAYRPHDSFGCYLVGSALERPDWRDVDIRMIMTDDGFRREFPDVPDISYACWEHDPKWVLITVSIAEWMRAQTGLPVDFQMHPRTFANARHSGPRSAMGLSYVSPRK